MPTKPTEILTVNGMADATASPHDALDSYDPEWDTPHAFSEALDRLTENYGAATRQLAYRDEETGEWVEMVGHRANVNPAWEGDGAEDCPKADAGWATVTDTYDPVNAKEAFNPLVAAATRAGAHEHVFGQFTLYRNGGEVTGDVFFPALEFDLSAGGDEVTLIPGVQMGYSHYADRNVYAEPIALHPDGGVFRHLAEKRTRRHVKSAASEGGTSVAEIEEWWTAELARLDDFGDALIQTVQAARDYTIAIPEPLDVPAFYEALGLPQELAERAANGVGGTSEPNAWSLYHAAAHVLTTDFDGKLNGSALRKHFRRINDILFRPPAAEQDAIKVWRKRDEADQTDMNGDSLRSRLRERADTLPDAADEFLTLRQRLRAIAEDAGEGEAEVAEVEA